MTDSFGTIPHLPTSHLSPGDVSLYDDDVGLFLGRRVLVYEKLDGVNVTLRRERVGVDVVLKRRWRGALAGALERGLHVWVMQRRDDVLAALPRGAELYVEWCRFTLTTRYSRLPAFGLGLGVRSPDGELLPRKGADPVFRRVRVPPNQPVYDGAIRDPKELKTRAGRSQFGRSRMEGLVVERQKGTEPRWAKWVRAGFHQLGPEDLHIDRRNAIASTQLGAGSIIERQ